MKTTIITNAEGIFTICKARKVKLKNLNVFKIPQTSLYQVSFKKTKRA